MNSIANGTNSIAKTTNSIAKVTNSIAQTFNIGEAQPRVRNIMYSWHNTVDN